MLPREFEVSSERAAFELLKEDGWRLRYAYQDYCAKAGPIPFERFELGVQILAEAFAAPSSTEGGGG